MVNNQAGRQEALFQVGPATSDAPGVMAAGGMWSLVLGTAVDPGWQALLAAALLALTVVLGMVWQSRARAARRWNATLDAYCAREIGRDRRRKAQR